MNTPNPESGSVAALPVLCPDCHWPTNRTWPESCETCGRRLPRPLAGANRPLPLAGSPHWPLEDPS